MQSAKLLLRQMLVIRDEQMKVLNESLRRAYIDEIAGLFVQGYPDKFTGGIADAKSFVEDNIPKASKYGISSQFHVALFLNFLVLHGEDFESRPECAWAVNILKSPGGTGDDRVEWLNARMENLAAMESAAPRGPETHG